MTTTQTTGYAKGANAGHVTTKREMKPKPSHRKGVRYVETSNRTVVGVGDFYRKL
jgi:large subunit ribosomal protein L36e